MNRPATVAEKNRKARRQRRQTQTRDEILDATRQVVLRDGLASFSLTKVADALGLTKPALYYYFPSKEALMFEILLREWVESAAEIEAAVEETESGADAVERLMRTAFNRYRNRLDLFGLVYLAQPSVRLENLVGHDQLQRIRPINDMFYAGAEARLRADQATNTVAVGRNPRRIAFTAHMAVIGILNMKAIAASADDPLIHSDDDLIDDICRTFRESITGGKR